MTISTEEVYLLNRKMGRVASKVQLGTLIQNAEAVVAADIALAESKVFVGNSSGVAAAVTLTGDVTNTNSGVTAIGSGKVLLAMLATGVAPSHVLKFAGKHTTVSGATQTITVTGVASTDIVHVTLQTVGGVPRTITTAAPTTNTITVVMSGDPSTDHILSYSVLRAAA